jgi:hypothetical protein
MINHMLLLLLLLQTPAVQCSGTLVGVTDGVQVWRASCWPWAHMQQQQPSWWLSVGILQVFWPGYWVCCSCCCS